MFRHAIPPMRAVGTTPDQLAGRASNKTYRTKITGDGVSTDSTQPALFRAHLAQTHPKPSPVVAAVWPLHQRSPKKPPGTRGGVPVLASRGEVVTLEHIQNLLDQEGV